jgi:uncharacterized membrane protein
MGTADEQLWWSLGYCAFMLILAYILRKFPPKKINHIYGYRTKRSMRNQDTWKMANDYSSELMLRFCLYSFMIPALGCFLFPEYNLLVTIIINTILVISIIYYTETHLKKHFDAEGNQISEDTNANF